MPYRTLFPAWTIARSPDAPLLTIALETGADGTPDRVVRLLLQRDLLFIAWDE